jgi:hypothetical protein
LIAAHAAGQTVHRAWSQSTFPHSITTAYRWVKRWHRNLGHLRSHLARAHPPPRQQCDSASASTYRHLIEAFPPADPCRIGAFQQLTQAHFLP